MQETLIAKILTKEWNMFQTIASVGGRAACQDNHKVFNIMRRSQAMAWSETALESYLDDLIEAERNNKNLLTEKYARMMEYTSPLEYAKIKHHLPELDCDTLSLIELIVKASLEWEQEIRIKFPYVSNLGRPASASNNTSQTTSIETYLRGELATYSPKTLLLYYQNILEQKAANINGVEITLTATMQHYGFNSLTEANEVIKKQQKE